MIDYRVKDYEVRKEFFKKYWYVSLKYNDCDPALFLMNYIFRRLELNKEQRFWLCFLYANTYQLSSAWIIANEFPDFENVGLERLKNWNKNNFKDLPYQNDCKWQKGYLPQMFESYKTNILKAADSQRRYFLSFCYGTPQENYERLRKEIMNNFYKMGRYVAWFYLQTLKECTGLKVEPTNLLLKEKSSNSHLRGLLFALGLDEYGEDKKIKLSNEAFEFLDKEASKLLREMKEEYKEVSPDYFNMETVLCAFKKVFRERDGRYLGYYLDRQAEDIKKCEVNKKWYGIDWQLLWDGRNEKIDKRFLKREINKKLFGELLRTGTVTNINL